MLKDDNQVSMYSTYRSDTIPVDHNQHPEMIKVLGIMSIAIITVWVALCYLYTRSSYTKCPKIGKKKEAENEKVHETKDILRKHVNQIVNRINILQPIDVRQR